MENSLARISRFLSLVLRHKPERIHLTLDEQGWADVAELLAHAQEAGVRIDEQVLHQVVAQNDKQRFSFSADGAKIRANQGHSIPVDLDLVPVTPPEVLYHGTATRFLASIQSTGLQPRKRQYVHLSADEKTATSVGKRHGQPVVLLIKAVEMARHGHAFYRSANGVWLTAAVPVEYIVFPE